MDCDNIDGFVQDQDIEKFIFSPFEIFCTIALSNGVVNVSTLPNSASTPLLILDPGVKYKLSFNPS